ncbi:protein of unknown function (plasmid) [Thermococcus nautili]|uniref:hypothetical protein n=1 Tax=Thermococcus nautili TaxID=195522 RepID=UPI002556675C|nr:hypothetical protein [Thermococcus nautili]CAI1494212.1 protein of unknown function [Thermococcus nautili]
MARRSWIKVYVAGKEWKFLKSNDLDHRNEWYRRCERVYEPYLEVERLSPTKYHVLIDFYPSCYDLKGDAVKKLDEIVKEYMLRSSKAHPRLEFSGSVGSTMVSFDVSKEFLKKAIEDVSKVALDPHNWELNDPCQRYKDMLFNLFVDSLAGATSMDFIDRKVIIQKAKEKLGLDWRETEILLSELIKEGKIGDVTGGRKTFYIKEPIPLKTYLEKKGLKDYIDLLEFMKNRLSLDIPDDVKILNWLEARDRYNPKPNVVALADVENNIVSFFNLNPYNFVHELLHIAGGDEIEAYDITPIILFLWENKDDPKLPRKIRIRDILKVPKSKLDGIVKKHGFKDIKDYFMIMGVIPYVYNANFELMDKYTEEDEAFAFVMEVSADLRNPINREILFDIVKLLAEEGEE